jgi:predicted nuclease of predicted toxin-antitoxin system
MKFLADENFPGEAVRFLRRAGHDVASVAADAPSSSDRDVLARASGEERVLLTFDKDFGELAWKERLPAGCGVILFRCAMPAPGLVGSALAAMVAQRDDWPGHFSVIEDGRVRMRPLDEGAK